MSSSSSTPVAGTMSVMRGRPAVSVPVLSNAKAFRDPRASSGPPPLISTPPRAARATPAKTALRVALASAPGLGATPTVLALTQLFRNGYSMTTQENGNTTPTVHGSANGMETLGQEL